MSSPIDNTWPNPPCANNNTLEKRKFQTDANGDVCVNVCTPMPNGNANVYLYDCQTYATGDIGNEECFISYTVPADRQLWANQLIVAFNGTGQFLLKVAGTTIMRLVTSPAQPTISIKLENAQPINTSESVEICFVGPCEGDYSASFIGTEFPT